MRKTISHIRFEEWVWIILTMMAMVMPVLKKAVPVLILLAAILALMNRPRINRSAGWLLLLLPIMYLLHALGLFFTIPERMAAALMELEIKLSYLAIPAFFFIIPAIPEKWKFRIMDGFMTGSFVFMIVAIIRASIRFSAYGKIGFFSYAELAINYHPTYAAVYVCIAMSWLMIRWQNGQIILNRSVHVILLLIQTIFVAMLASKAGILSMVIVLIWSQSGRLVPRFGVKIPFWTTVILSVTLTGAVLLTPARKRIKSATATKVEAEDKNSPALSSTALRLVVWEASWKLLKENPFGLGTGNVEPALNAEYERMGESKALDDKLNCHNQFLQVALEHGWIASILLIAIFIVAFVGALDRQNTLLMLLIILIVVNMLFESFWERQEGIVFSLFFLLFHLCDQQQFPGGSNSAGSVV